MPKASVKMEFSVPADRVDEMRLAWREVISGQRTVARALAEHRDEVAVRGRVGLQTILTAIQGNPGTGQVTRLVRFLAGIYNGPQFPFDMTDLRTLDGNLRDACLDVLELDTYGFSEVHQWGLIDGKSIEAIFTKYGLYDALTD